jgi:hypothetical protein
VNAAVLLFLLPLLQDAEAPPEPESAWFPEGLAYRHPMADPREPMSGVRLQFPLRSGDDPKIENRIGIQYAVWRSGDVDGRCFEIQAEGAVHARFDMVHILDMDAADFRFGFPLVWRDGEIAYKIHAWHMTSHLGDEYIERTGRLRYVYARNEICGGVSYDLDPEWRTYGEVGFAFTMGEVNERWRVMGGVETLAHHLGPDWPKTFVALNLTSFQEQDWGVQFNIEGGFWFAPGKTDRGVRLTLGYFRGPSPLTQFFDENEHYWSFGFSLPL